jgi:DNA primase small subunit
VHPKTGKVCVPIDPAAAWEFDPDEVPTVQQLVKELAEQQQAAGQDAASKVRLALGQEINCFKTSCLGVGGVVRSRGMK